jgi:hypothetical protein
MREVFDWGAVSLMAGACIGLHWPLMLAGIGAMSVAFVTVFIYYAAKGKR